MSCNCATTKQIEELHARFGVGIKPPVGAKLSYKIKFYTENFLATLILLTALPLMLHFVCQKQHDGDGRISLKEFFDLKADNLPYE